MTNQELFSAANAAFNAGDVDRTIATLGSVGSQDGNLYSQSLVLMGRAYGRKRDFEQARLCLEEAYKIRKSARTLFHLGECLYQSGDRLGAEECLEAATGAEETLTDAFILLGIVRKETGRLKEALPCFDRALKNDPKAVVARFQIAQVTYELGDLQRAAAQAHHVLQHADDFVPAHLLMANITLKLGDYRQAAVEFVRVIELGGADAGIYLSLGRAFAHLQDYDQAIQAFEAACQMDPSHEMACSAVARLAERRGNTQKAAEYYRKLMRFEASAQLASEALERLGLPSEPPAAGSKKGKKKAAAAPVSAPATHFQAPKMIDRASLPSNLPNRATGRLIGTNQTAPLSRHVESPPAQRPRATSAPTTPLDNLLEGINRMIDRSPLKGSLDPKAMGDLASAASSALQRVKADLLSRVPRKEAPSAPSRPAPNRPEPPATFSLQKPGSGSLASKPDVKPTKPKR